MEKSSLTALARELLEHATTTSSGRGADTVYGGHEHVLRQTVIALAAGHSLTEHENPGEATVQVLRGRVRHRAPGTSRGRARRATCSSCPQARHSLEALEDSAVLLTVAKLP